MWWRSLSRLSKAYLVCGSALAVLFLASAAWGWELTAPSHRFIPGDIRNSPGGYRSFHFWHSGYQGGK
jgi:hypothetical protein